MGRDTKIAWAEASHNFWTGCNKVSQGCKHCYAERIMRGYGQPFKDVRRTKGFDAPRHWDEPARIFTCSMSDFFHPAADPWRDEAWEVIRATPWHTWMILTKRPERIAAALPPGWLESFRHVWLGVSVENQAATPRLDVLAGVEASVRFVSCEPLLGPLDLQPWLVPRCPSCETVLGDRYGTWVVRQGKWAHYCGGYPYGEAKPTRAALDWVQVGGESGPDFRPMSMGWALKLYRQCAEYNVPYYFKQQAGPHTNYQPWLEFDGGQITARQFPPEELGGDPNSKPHQLTLFGSED